jgi:protein-tyrosine phosphatase
MISAGKQRILFVCAGNICRSPAAEVVFRTLVLQADLGDSVEVDSAGTHGYHVGEAPDPRMQKAAARRGFDLSALRSRQIRGADFDDFDLILALDRDCLARLVKQCPADRFDRLGLVMDYAAKFPGDDVPDPYYGGASGFDRVLDLVEDASAGLLVALRRKAA